MLLPLRRHRERTPGHEERRNSNRQRNGCPAQDNSPAGPQDDRKRRTPCREGRPGVEGAESGDCGVFRRANLICEQGKIRCTTPHIHPILTLTKKYDIVKATRYKGGQSGMAPDFSSEKELTFTLLGEEQPSLLWGDGARLIFVLYGSVSVLLRGQSEVLSQAGLQPILSI